LGFELHAVCPTRARCCSRSKTRLRQTGIWREKGKVQIQRGKFRQRASSSWDEIKKHEYVNKLDSWARGADAMAFIVLFMFLGIIAAQVVEYQINHQQL
jgi:hypothetical protein